MRVGSLFSGIGGLDLGLERAGMEVVWQVEVDEWCRRVLARHWPDVARFRDVRDCHGAYAVANTEARGDERQGEQAGVLVRTLNGCEGHLPPVDLICGGFPCQPVSHAGRRAGESDSRWLWPEFYRIIREVKPRWVLVENVPGLRSIDDGRLFGGILRDLAEAGYDAVWFDLSATDVGAPHLRERVFIVAHASSSGHDGHLPTRASREAWFTPKGYGQWTVEPDIRRVAHGIPARVDRLRGLGNAVVPQVAETIGRWIMDGEKI